MKNTKENRKEIETQYKYLIEKIRRYSKNINCSKIRKAFLFAKEKHQKQFRDSGEPYILHPLTVAQILTEYSADEETLIAALLHDIIEDTTKTSLRDLRRLFGKTVADVVCGVTEISHLQPILTTEQNLLYSEKEIQDIETIRQIFNAAKDDIRVILLKLADRLHNMRTLKGKKEPSKRKKKAEETMMIFLPIAMRLGIWKMKKEFESLCLPYIFPETHKNVLLFLKNTAPEKESILKKIIKNLKSKDTKNLIVSAEKYDRSLLYLQQKQQKEGLCRDDNFLIKICVHTEDNCFLLLRLIHKIFKTIISEKDSVSNPRDNGYRAYEIVVITDEGYRLVLRIMTESMEKRNWLGMAFDFFHEQKGKKTPFLHLFPNININTKGQSEAFLHAARVDLLEERIIVSSEGKNFFIPKNSTALDFVFFAFPKKADYIHRIKRDGSFLAFGEILKEKNILTLEWTNTSQVSHEWFYLIHTTTARIGIQNSLLKGSIKTKKNVGHSALQQEFDLYEKGRIEDICLPFQKKEQKTFGASSFENLLVLIAEGYFRPYDILKYYFPDQKIGWGKRILEWGNRIFYRSWKESAPKMRLSIEGFFKEQNDFWKGLQNIRKQFFVFLTKSSTEKSYTTQIMRIKIECQLQKPERLHHFIEALRRHPGITRVTILPSTRIIRIFLSWFLGTLFMWVGMSLFLFLAESEFSEWTPFWQNIFLYTSLLPVLMINYFFVLFIRNYFPYIRHSKFIMTLGIGLNFSAFLLFLRTATTYEDFSTLLLIPLGLFLISVLWLPSTTVAQKKAEPLFVNTKINWSEKKKEKIKGYMFRLGAILLFGTTPVVVKYFLEGVSGIVVTSLGFSLALLALSPLILYKIINKQVGKSAGYCRYFWISILFDGGMLLFYFLSVHFTVASNSVLFLNFAPVVAIIFALLFWKEKMPYFQKKADSIRIISVFTIGTVGSLLLVLNKGFEIDYETKILGDFFGFMALVVDVVATVALITYTKSKSAFSGIDYILRKILILGVLLLPFSLHFLFSSDSALSAKNIIGIAFVAFGYIILGYWCAYEAFLRVNGFINYLLINLAPIVTFLLEYYYFNLNVTPIFLLGAGLIILSSVSAEWINSQCETQRRS